MTVELLPTKDKILVAAGSLFAKKGLAGTSVREIASEAGVNLSAINYHFENKQNLYFATFAKAHKDLNIAIDSLDPSLSASDLAWGIYGIMGKMSEHIRHSFTMMISDMSNLEELQASNLSKMTDGLPPGLQRLSGAIAKEHGGRLDQYTVFLISISIFHQLIHTCLLMHSTFFHRVACMRSDEDTSVTYDEGNAQSELTDRLTSDGKRVLHCRGNEMEVALKLQIQAVLAYAGSQECGNVIAANRVM